MLLFATNPIFIDSYKNSLGVGKSPEWIYQTPSNIRVWQINVDRKGAVKWRLRAPTKLKTTANLQL